jgi:hypothetical protein
VVSGYPDLPIYMYGPKTHQSKAFLGIKRCRGAAGNEMDQLLTMGQQLLAHVSGFSIF